jgi:hypothetical protein
MDKHKQYVLIIDSFRSHNALVYKCFAQNIIPIHIFSSKKIFEETFFAVSNHFFIKSFICEDFNKLIEDIKEYNIQFVFSCTDGSQQLKDRIDYALNLPNRNSAVFAESRYNKFLLYQTLGQPASSINFKDFVNNHKDCVIKPAPVKYSGGCLDVMFVTEETSNIADKENFFISKFFDGDEYAVDFVSCQGRHKLVSVWKYIRNSTDKIWKDRVELMHYDEDPALINKIYQASTDWLDKIEHTFGPVHLEIKHNNSQFFCVEMNFRLNGHMYYGSLLKQLEINQIDLTVDCYTLQEKFSGELIKYNARGYINRVYLMNTLPNRKHNDINWKSLETAESVDIVFKHVWPWEELPISEKTYQSASAIVIMSNADKTVLLLHENKIKEIFNQTLPDTV